MIKQIAPCDKINNAIALLSEIARTNDIALYGKNWSIQNYKEKHATRYNNFVELSKLAELQRIYGSIDKLIKHHCNAVTIGISSDTSRYCEKHGIKQIDDIEKFIVWLAEEDARIDAECEAFNAAESAKHAPIPPMTTEQRRELLASNRLVVE